MLNVSRSAKPGKMFRRSINGGDAMKKSLAAIVGFLIVGTALGQTFTAPSGQRRIQPKPKLPPPITSRDVQGVIPRAIRGGNPAQMLNPRAPAKYGTSQQSVTLKPDGSGRWNGIKLFEILF
jgi:hypothetical protein